MIPLGGKDFPATAADLADALRAALREVVRLPDEGAAVTVDADRLRIDLSGGVAAVPSQLADTAGVGQTQPGPSFKSLEVLADPVVVEGAKIHFDLTAAAVSFNFDRTRAGRPVMTLASAIDGRVTARVSRAELEALVTTKAKEAARQKGVDVERIDFNFTQLGPRSVRLEATAAVAAKAYFTTARGAVVFGGRVDIDNRLVAKLSELNLAGQGIIIAAAVAFYRSRITAFEGKEFPLTTFALGGIRLRDVQLQVGDEFAVTAAFGC
jgi:hypothetical protein